MKENRPAPPLVKALWMFAARHVLQNIRFVEDSNSSQSNWESQSELKVRVTFEADPGVESGLDFLAEGVWGVSAISSGKASSALRFLKRRIETANVVPSRCRCEMNIDYEFILAKKNSQINANQAYIICCWVFSLFFNAQNTPIELQKQVSNDAAMSRNKIVLPVPNCPLTLYLINRRPLIFINKQYTVL